jgi:transcription initiation factor TFIIIB Brf1 subunit/transcription initiation factor TFIIB
MQYSSDSSIICTSCRSQAVITDPESGETICSNCGMVIFDRTDDIVHQEKHAYTFEEIDKNARIGPPSSLARHDKGLSTVIGRSDKDAGGQKIVNSMYSSFERLRTWDYRIQVNSSTDKNLSKAFSERKKYYRSISFGIVYCVQRYRYLQNNKGYSLGKQYQTERYRKKLQIVN